MKLGDVSVIHIFSSFGNPVDVIRIRGYTGNNGIKLGHVTGNAGRIRNDEFIRFVILGPFLFCEMTIIKEREK